MTSTLPQTGASNRGQYTIWDHCYGDGWQGIITKESFAHPAKFSKALIERIFDHCLQRGWLKKNDLVGDCFGGIGNGGIIAAYRGLRWVGCELEPRFCTFARDNFELHADHWRALGLSVPRIIQGDSRRFAELVACDGIVTSPPFSENGKTINMKGNARQALTSESRQVHEPAYGSSSGQIGRLKSGDISAVLTSPPYAHIAAGAGGLNTKPAKELGQQSGRCSDSASQTADQRYGNSNGQIAGLNEGTIEGVITSPPFTQGYKSGGGINVNGYGDGSDKVGDRTYQGTGADRETGNIETLPAGNVDGVVTSPPFEKTLDRGTVNAAERRSLARECGISNAEHISPIDMEKIGKRSQPDYGAETGQIGNEKGETYWQAMKSVYSSCFIAIKPGGIIVVVVKDYVQNKKIVPLCDDTARLLEHCGFQIVERVHAMLTKETRHGDLFNGETVTTKSRKSFFRRLAEKKGSPPIDFEEVLFAQKPGMTNSHQSALAMNASEVFKR